VTNLAITNCFAGDEAAIKNVFVFTPRMKSLRFVLANRSEADLDMLKRAFVVLQQDGFINSNLERFQCRGNSIEVTELSRMFPRLNEIVCSRLVMAQQCVVECPSLSSVSLSSLSMLVIRSTYLH
jgi:Ran GTPase-activating protein (RanGAP) involved in mRNA processing and transport